MVETGGYKPHAYSGTSCIEATDGFQTDKSAWVSLVSDLSITCPCSSTGARENGSLYRLGGRQEMDAFMPAPLACQTEVDQAGMRGGRDNLKIC